MPLFYSPATVPELAEVKRLPAEERQRIWKNCMPRVWKQPLAWIGAVLGVALAVGLYVLLRGLLLGWGLGGFVNGFLSGAAGGVVGGTVFAQCFSRAALPCLREELQKRRATDPPDA